MVGQISNTVTYHRRYNLLNNLVGSLNQAREALREKKDILQKHDGNLLGKKFRNHIVEVNKTRKTTIEVFSAGKSKSGISRREPFPEVLQHKYQKRGRAAGRQILKATNKDGSNKTPIRIEEEYSNTQAKEEEDMVRLNKNLHFRIVADVALVLEEDLKLAHPILKRFSYKKVLPNFPLAERLKHFYKNWEL